MTSRMKPTIGMLTRACPVLALALSLLAFAGLATAANADRHAAPAIATPKEKVSYSLGLVLGRQFLDQSIDVDTDLYLRGLKDGLGGGGTLLTEKEARSVVDALQREVKRRQARAKAPGGQAGLAVSFKVDPRLTKGLYMGDRWVSPATYVGTNGQDTVEARVKGVDAGGAAVAVSPTWIPADPAMVTVTPGQGNEVRITVRRAGESKLKVSSPGFSRELAVKATYQDNTIRVQITQ